MIKKVMPPDDRRRSATKFSILALLVCVLLLLGPVVNTSAEHIFIPRRDVAAQNSLDVEVTYELLHVRSGNELPLTVIVTHRGAPVEGVLVNMSCTAPGNCTFRFEDRITDVDGKVAVYLTACTEKEMQIDVIAIAYHANYTSSSYRVEDVTIEPPVGPWPAKSISYLGLGGLLALGLIAMTESGKYGLLKLTLVPLYSRLKKDDLLDHFVRGQIYGYIMSHPGEHYNRIKQKLEVTNGTLSHHLRALEMQGYVKSHRDGTYKRFYPTGMKIPRRKGIQLSDLQIGIIDSIRQTPGITQKDIAKSEGISQQSVSYNLTVLARIGILSSERHGVRKKYFLLQEM